MLTVYALGAPPSAIQKQYDGNTNYQIPLKHPKNDVSNDLADVEGFKKYLGRDEHYQSFVVFFQDEIDKKGWQAVLNEYLFARDPRADDMLARLFGGGSILAI